MAEVGGATRSSSWLWPKDEEAGRAAINTAAYVSVILAALEAGIGIGAVLTNQTIAGFDGWILVDATLFGALGDRLLRGSPSWAYAALAFYGLQVASKALGFAPGSINAITLLALVVYVSGARGAFVVSGAHNPPSTTALSGWMRLWIVTSGLWLIVVLLAGWNPPNEFSYVVESGALERLPADVRQSLATSVYSFETDKRTWVQIDLSGHKVHAAPHLFDNNLSCAACADYVAQIPAALQDARAQHFQELALFALAPPTTLYILGWLTGWVWRGFTRQRR